MPKDNSAVFEKTCFLGPQCTLIRRFFNWIGATMALIACCLDILYMGKVVFQNKGIYVGYVLFWTLRLLITFALGVYYFKTMGLDYRPRMASGVREEN